MYICLYTDINIIIYNCDYINIVKYNIDTINYHPKTI